MKIFAALLCLSSLLLFAAPAHAEDAAAEAKRLFLEGKSHYNNRSYVEALQAFQQALARVQRSSVVIMVARCYRMLDRPDRAMEYYQRYRLAWKKERPGKPSPHRGEVKSQLSKLRTILDLVRRGEALQQRQPAAALALFQTALGICPWPRIYRNMALCQLILNRPLKALSPLKVALGYWERHRVDWTSRHPGTAPPDSQELDRRIADLKQLELKIRQAQGARTPPRTAREPAERRPSPVTVKPPPPGASQQPRPQQRSKLWLAMGISAAVLVVAGEAVAWTGFARAGDYHEDQPEFGTYRDMTIAGHLVAGTMAAAAAVSFYLYHRGGQRPPSDAGAGVMLLPGGRGWAMMARWDF